VGGQAVDISTDVVIGDDPTLPVHGSHGSRHVIAAWLTALVAVGTLLRLYGLATDDYWLDELRSLMNSGGRYAAPYELPHEQILNGVDSLTAIGPGTSLADVWRASGRDVHPPLYFLLLRIWRESFGDGEAATRSLSVLFSVLTLVPLALILKAMGRPRAGIVAAAILAGSFGSMFVAQQARPYSLSMLLVCTSYWLFVERLARSGERRRCSHWWDVGYSVSLLLAVLTHYFTVLALAPQLPFALTRKERKFKRAACVCAVAAALVWCVLWGPSLVAQLPAIRDQPWLHDEAPGHAIHTVVRFVDLPVRLLFAHDLYAHDIMRTLVGLVLVVGLVTSLIRKRPAGTIMFALWFAAPALMLMIVDLAEHTQTLAFLRYTSVATPALAALVGLAVDSFPRVLRRVMLVAWFTAVAMTIRLPTTQNPEARAAAEVVASYATDHTLVVYDAMDWPRYWAMRQVGLVSYYMPINHPPLVLIDHAVSPELADAMKAYARLIVVAPQQHLDAPLRRGFHLSFASEYIAGIGYVYVYDAGGRE